MITAFINRFKGMSRDLVLFLVVSFGVGLAGSLVESTFKWADLTFWEDHHGVSGFQVSDGCID